MSEYQYYEFLAIDRPLTESAMAELRDISTRAHITPTSFVNHYEWGDLKARPIVMMEKYFDAFVYVANWGTREFMLRVPRRFLDPKTVSTYKAGNALSFEAKGEHVIITFMSDQEPEDDSESGEGRLSSLVPLRADILDGDASCLYLGWLLGAQLGEVKESALEPPVPPGLTKLSGPLKGLADFLRIDRDLIEAASQGNGAPPVESPTAGELDRWVEALPSSEKDAAHPVREGGRPSRQSRSAPAISALLSQGPDWRRWEAEERQGASRCRGRAQQHPTS